MEFSQGDPSSVASSDPVPFLALEVGEIETRLRKHIIELVEPALARTSACERRLHELQLYQELHAEKLKQVELKLSGQEHLKLTLESFRGQLYEWDKERRDHQAIMNEKLCLQEDEASALHRKMELQSVKTEACNRGLKHLGDLLTETREEVSELRSYCSERIDMNRDKIVKLRDELEAKHSAIEVCQFKLNDHVTDMTTAFQHINSAVEQIGKDTAEAVSGVAELWRVKATSASVEEQQETFAEFSQSLTNAVGSLKLQLENIMTDLQDHFQTAAQVLSVSSSTQIASMRDQYAEDMKRMASIIQEHDSLNQRASLTWDTINTFFLARLCRRSIFDGRCEKSFLQCKSFCLSTWGLCTSSDKILR